MLLVWTDHEYFPTCVIGGLDDVNDLIQTMLWLNRVCAH